MRLVNWRALVAGAAGLGLAACGDDVTIPASNLQYTVNPSAVSCTTGQTTAVGLTVTGGTGTPSISFSAQNSGITVTGSGSSATVVCGNTAGAAAVNFTITSGGQTVQGSIPVTVTAAPTPPATVTAIAINPTSASVVAGDISAFM